jgi:hypothetical protein
LPGVVWAFEKTGVQPLLRAYRQLVRALSVDALVLVDGGIDLILRGDESSLGTPSEDLCSLAAARRLDGVFSAIACVGFGAELRDGVCHEQALARIAELTARGGILGAASIAGCEAARGAYVGALQHAFAHQARVRTSHIHTVVHRALAGEFGQVAPEVWLSPLMPLVWFFDLATVADTHLFLGELERTESIGEVAPIIEACRRSCTIRPRSDIPI